MKHFTVLNANASRVFSPLVMAAILIISAASLESSYAAPSTTGKDWIQVRATLPGHPYSIYYCKATECGASFTAKSGQKARLYMAKCKSTSECEISPLEDYWLYYEKETNVVGFSAVKFSIYSDGNNAHRRIAGAEWEYPITLQPDTRRITEVAAPAPPLPTPPSAKTCDSEFKRICGETAVRNVATVQACFKDSKDPNKIDEAKLAGIKLDLDDDTHACVLSIQTLFGAPAPTSQETGLSQGADVQKAIGAIFQNPVQKATVEYLIDKDNTCDAGSLCGNLTAFAQKDCKNGSDGKLSSECSDLYEKITTDVGANGKVGRIGKEWQSLFAAAKPTATLADEKWLRDLKDSQPLADKIVKKFDAGAIKQPDLNAFYQDLKGLLCVRASSGTPNGAPRVGPQTGDKFGPAKEAVQQAQGVTAGTIDAAAAPSDDAVRAAAAEPFTGAATASGPALLCQGPGAPASTQPPGPPSAHQPPPPPSPTGPLTVAPTGLKSPEAVDPPSGGSGAFGTVAALSVGAAGGALLGLCLAFGFGWPLFAGALIGAAVGIGIFYLSRQPPWGKK